MTFVNEIQSKSGVENGMQSIASRVNQHDEDSVQTDVDATDYRVATCAGVIDGCDSI